MSVQRDYGPGWRFPLGRDGDGVVFSPKVDTALNLFFAAYAGWLVGQGGGDVAVGLILLTGIAVVALAPPRLQRRLLWGMVAVVVAVVLADQIGLLGSVTTDDPFPANV